MLKKFLAAAFVLTSASLALADSASAVVYVTPDNYDVSDYTGDPNSANFPGEGTAGIMGDLRVGNYWTIDLRQTIVNKWAQAKSLAMIMGGGTFWTHPDLHKDSPRTNASAAGAKSLIYDCFYTLPSTGAFTTLGAPSFTGPGNTVDADTIRGEDTNNDGAADTGRTWFQAGSTIGPLTNALIARYTVLLTDPLDSLSLVADAMHPAVFMTMTGLVAGVGVGITNFSITIYHTPEPSTIALLALGGLVGLIRRR
jgi:hypothetical protein